MVQAAREELAEPEAQVEQQAQPELAGQQGQGELGRLMPLA
jgi:hypothetical protein